MNIKNFENFPNQNSSAERLSVKDALHQAGLLNIEPPQEGTPAYERLITAAQKYMEEIIRIDMKNQGTKSDSENYFKSKKQGSSSSDSPRRENHDKLCLMLLGKSRRDLSSDMRDRVSDFAAYLQGHEKYIGTW